jgi:hypothetical protein
MEDKMHTDTDGENEQMPCDIILTSEPFFVEVSEEVLADGSKVIHLRGDAQLQLRAVPPAVRAM